MPTSAANEELLRRIRTEQPRYYRTRRGRLRRIPWQTILKEKLIGRLQLFTVDGTAIVSDDESSI